MSLAKIGQCHFTNLPYMVILSYGQYPKNRCQGDKIQPKLQLQKTSFTAAVAILPLLLLLPHEKTLQTTFFPAKSSENYSDDDYVDYDNGFGENPANDLLLSTECVTMG